MTEEEAREKWCPFSRYHPDIPGVETQWKSAEGAANRFNQMTAGPLALQSCRCIASSCMAWRWSPTGAEEGVVSAVKRHREENNSTLAEAHAYVTTHPEYRKAPNPPNTGYCGLAGRPVA